MRVPRILFLMLLTILVAAGCSSAPTGSQANGGQTQQNNTPEKPATEQATPAQHNQTAIKKPDALKQKQVAFIYTDDNLMDQYKEMHTIQYKTVDELPLLALKEWQKGPQNKKLICLLPPSVEIQSVKRDGDNAVVSFSSNIKKAANMGSTGEDLLVKQVATIMNQLGFKDTMFEIDGKKIESLLGHVDTTTPAQPLDLTQVKQMK
ncbi:GerMN domain-containing protein [Aneurinibacillus sp. Ricciae_BoGa-3]|uniref:GerMN domain-containing protein n=1 Tax=Aneurinibacillus sp. Ricciae_BoGa-3 TaxID=3022697 RepID=UPI0023419BA7|nr:GerMN domain-containing protein [Aneurinibacillus sp. Ricciae_BoGa-3]WCK52788.1 GerMN domain-containing protein [Aneurinibacillus sp. Ricciae_BoGa-3]